MYRAFEVRARRKGDVCYLSNMLDRELALLQKEGWEIVSVTSTPVDEYEYPGHFVSTLFTIVARKDVELRNVPIIDEFLERIASGGDTYPSDIREEK